MATILSRVLNAVKTKDPSYLEAVSKSPEAMAVDSVADGGSEIAEGIKNWWYKNTGRAHLTPEYQHEEDLANSAIQREAADMAAAGLSKYGGVSGASTPTPQSGNGLLSSALAMSNLASGIMSLKERAWNYGVSKGLGIRTNDKNPLSQISSIFKILTGKNLSDFSDGDGVIGAIRDWWNGLSFNNNATDVSNGDSNNPSNILTGASIDGVQDYLENVPFTTTLKPISVIPADAAKDIKSNPTKVTEKLVQDVTPGLGYTDAVSSIMKTLVSKGRFDSSTLFSLAHSLSKRYNISQDKALDDLFDAWDRFKETEEPGSINFISH